MQFEAGRWMTMTALVAICASACSDDNDGAPIRAAGNAGKGGAGVTGGAGGKGGAGGRAAAGSAGQGGSTIGGGGDGGDGGCQEDDEGCPNVDACGPLPLAELCSERPSVCLDLDELDLTTLCTHATTVTARGLSCGGQVIVADYGLGADTWGFDASGTLKYKRVDSDTYVVCRDGKGLSASTIWGELPCNAAGPVTDLCGEGGAGGGGGEGGHAN